MFPEFFGILSKLRRWVRTPCLGMESLEAHRPIAAASLSKELADLGEEIAKQCGYEEQCPGEQRSKFELKLHRAKPRCPT